MPEVFRQACENCIRRLHRNILRIFLKKSYISFYYFWTLTVKNYPTFGKKMGKLVRNVIWAFRRTYCEKTQFFCKKIYVLLDRFGLPVKIFENFGKNNSAGLPQLHFTCQGKSLSKTKFLKTFIFEDLVNLVKTFRTFDETYSTGLSKLKSTFPENRSRIFLKKITFLFIVFGLHPQKIQPILAEKFRQAC